MKNLLLVLLLFCNVAYSQSFKPITNNSKVNLYYSESGDQSIRGFRVDSIVKDRNFEVINFHKEYNDDWRNCVKPLSASWLGEKSVIDTSMQIAYFFNESNDTLLLKYSAQVGESWNFYNKGNIIIKAKVIGINLEKLQNEKEEVVKSIQLYKYNSSGKDEWENYKLTLKISENFGFTQLIGFRALPELYMNMFDDYLFQFKSIPNRIIKLSDIYNYNVGDIFEYRVRDIDNLTDYHLMQVLKKYSPTKFLIANTYQNNTDYRDTIITHVTYTNIDTFKILINDTIFNGLKRLPMETFMLKGSQPTAIYKEVFFRDNLFYFPSGAEGFYHEKNKDTCWEMQFEAPFSGPYEFKEGYGYVIKNEPYGIYQWIERETMIYSKKGNITTGKFVSLGLNEIKSETIFFIYPNPSSKTVFINSGNIKIEGYKICSINGQTLMEASDYNKNGGIDISGLADGLYFINLKSEEGNLTIRFLKTENK